MMGSQQIPACAPGITSELSDAERVERDGANHGKAMKNLPNVVAVYCRRSKACYEGDLYRITVLIRPAGTGFHSVPGPKRAAFITARTFADVDRIADKYIAAVANAIPLYRGTVVEARAAWTKDQGI